MTPGAQSQQPVAIIGAGAIGQTIGHLLARAGYPVVISWSSSDQRLRRAAENIGFGARSATPAEAVAQAGAVIFAPRFEHIDAASRAAGDLTDKILIDTTNPYNPQRDGVVDLSGQSPAEHVRSRLAGARYVKGFNTLTATFLRGSAGRVGPDRVVVFLSGDDLEAKQAAALLVRAAGFDPVDLGTIADSHRQSPGGDLYGEEYRLADVPTLPRL